MMLEVNKPSEISLLNAVIMLAQKWRNVSADTIHNCFKKSFHEIAQEDQSETSGVEDRNFRDDMSILKLKNCFQNKKYLQLNGTYDSVRHDETTTFGAKISNDKGN